MCCRRVESLSLDQWHRRKHHSVWNLCSNRFSRLRNTHHKSTCSAIGHNPVFTGVPTAEYDPIPIGCSYSVVLFQHRHLEIFQWRFISFWRPIHHEPSAHWPPRVWADLSRSGRHLFQLRTQKQHVAVRSGCVRTYNPKSGW